MTYFHDRLDEWIDRNFARADAEQPRDDKGQFAAVPGHISAMTKIGPQLGSNPGGQYQDAAGKKFYVKHAKSEAHAANEVLAGHLYRAAGAPITQAHRIDLGDGKHGVASAWAEHGGKFDPKDQAHLAEARKHFGTHAWLANHDAIGLGNDNQVPISGKLHTVDAGGAMRYRAQGGDKQSWGPSVGEFHSMRDAKIAPQAAAVFGGMTPEEVLHSSSRVAEVDDDHIHALAQAHGHGTPEERKAIAEMLIARKSDLMKRAWTK